MKQKVLLALLFMILFLTGCQIVIQNDVPQVPTGLTSITGDYKVTLYWNPVSAPDFMQFNVYRSYDPTGPYTIIGSTVSAFYVDRDVCNGVTYYYAVTSVNYDGNESELSREDVFDTPRPEGYGAVLWDRWEYPNDAGFDLASECIVPYYSSDANIYLESDTCSGIYYLVAGAYNNDIQDFGYINSLDDIDYAPEEGWSNTGKVEVIEGHGYVIWTNDNHFAKVRIESICNDHVILSWAYQIDEGNRELSLKTSNFGR